MKEYIQITTTTDTKENAEKIVNTLVQNHLAACVQIIGPITSIYWWKQKVEETTEWMCIAKTRKDLYKAAETSIRSNHPYETPETLATPITNGSEECLSWLDRELRK